MYAKSIRPSAKRKVQKSALKLVSDENVPAKRTDFFICHWQVVCFFDKNVRF